MCTGTADVAIGARAARGAARVVGVDFSGAMLTHGLDKVRHAALGARIQLIRGDAMNLPVASGSVDAATIAFGIRNVLRPEVACAELLQGAPAGRPPRDPRVRHPQSPVFGPIYHWYSRNILPRIGRVVSRHDAAYTYLPESIGAFAYGEEFAGILRAAGFSQVAGPAINVRRRLSVYRAKGLRS